MAGRAAGPASRPSARRWAGDPQVHGVFATSGLTNLMAAVFCPDHGGLYRFVTDTLGPLGVGRAETVIVARAVKRAGVPLRPPGAGAVRARASRP